MILLKCVFGWLSIIALPFVVLALIAFSASLYIHFIMLHGFKDGREIFKRVMKRMEFALSYDSDVDRF